MIKKVVDKPKVQVVKKFPEFDSSKIYINDLLRTFIRHGSKFITTEVGNSAFCSSSSYKNFEDYMSQNCSALSLYILDNQQELARFILGCREFPKVEEIEETVGQELAEDEVSVEDMYYCAGDKIVALKAPDGDYYVMAQTGFGKYNAICLSSFNRLTEENNSFSQFLTQKIAEDYLVYQFDTQEEFLRWSLEQTTGESNSGLMELVKHLAGVSGCDSENCSNRPNCIGCNRYEIPKELDNYILVRKN